MRYMLKPYERACVLEEVLIMLAADRFKASEVCHTLPLPSPMYPHHVLGHWVTSQLIGLRIAGRKHHTAVL